MPRALVFFSAFTLALPPAVAPAATFTANTAIAAADSTYDGQPILVSNCTLTVSGPHSFASLYLTNGAVLTQLAAPDGETNNRLQLAITGDLTVPADCRVEASGLGWAAAKGPGAGGDNFVNTVGGSGGGHGGRGGAGGTTAGGAVYGQILAPVEPGSGGGAGYLEYSGPMPGTGGAGGGAIRLSVGGILELNGGIYANGVIGPAGADFRSGGGAGGSIWITAGQLAGAGAIEASGGASTLGGGGGGGRIALCFDSSSFTGPCRARGGTGGTAGGAGTVYVRTNSAPRGTVVVDNNGAAGVTILRDDQWPADQSFDMTMSGAVVIPETPVTLAGLTLLNGAQWRYPAGATNLPVTVQGDVLVASNCQFNATGLGWAFGSGPGAGADNGSSLVGGSGGGHGGRGGAGGTTAGGAVYGQILAPVEPGSGGGAGYLEYHGLPDAKGGAGGGAIRLSVGGILELNGGICANGAIGPVDAGVRGGGGAGGSVWITAGQLAGAGTIEASGGTSTLGGGGGGGRVALYFDSSSFTGPCRARGGTGGMAGGAGTVYVRTNSAPRGTVVVDNNGAAGVTILRDDQWTADQSFDLTMSGAVVIPETPVTFASLTMTDGAQWTHPAGVAGFHVVVQGDASVASNCQFNASGLGWPAASGPEAGADNNVMTAGGSGGGHGGRGGDGGTTAGGSTNGSPDAPASLGSGGGAGYLDNVGQSCATGGAGGGAIRLTVGGVLTLDGGIFVNGAVGPVAGSYRGGGGAGGSVWITADQLVGTGQIEARGGAAILGGGGGGGRIALYVRDGSGYDGTKDYSGGAANVSPGEAGTLVAFYLPPFVLNCAATVAGTRLEWLSVARTNYQLQVSSDLVNWNNAGPIQPGTGAKLTDLIAPTNVPRLFFRAVVGP